MISLKKHNKGFTIVELLIVIVVIGILALLVITTYSGIQAKARNAKRASDLDAVQTQLEAFYQDNGYYPAETNMADNSWVTTNMKSLDLEALNDPSDGNAKDITAGPNSINSDSADYANPVGASKEYVYDAFESDGKTACTDGDTNCSEYTLTATYEGTYNGATTITKKNLD